MSPIDLIFFFDTVMGLVHLVMNRQPKNTELSVVHIPQFISFMDINSSQIVTVSEIRSFFPP